MVGTAAVLTFHGLCKDATDTGVLDSSLHLPTSTFRAVCEHLSHAYQVMPLGEIMRLLNTGEMLPRAAVALTFDDGLASNYHLGFPILKEFGLPATIFLTTGFLDGTHPLWFQEVDATFKARSASTSDLFEKLQHLKSLPDPEMRAQISKLGPLKEGPAPEVTMPMTWDHVREMSASGLIDFGGHTHTHPILSRCSLEQQSEEIRRCRDRIQMEVGQAPRHFAYTNGGPSDFQEQTAQLLAEHGFEAAFTMIPARLGQSSARYALPRYGNPTSRLEAQATASGAFEMVKKWKGGRA
jgi:peptidoglycan/xylan/chitin deacetylase (PgdA/CDA1 family)